MFSVRSTIRRLREGAFSEETLDRLQAWIVFAGVPLMLALVIVLMFVVGSWINEAKQREELRSQRMEDAVEAIVEEIRHPGDEDKRDTREETFDRTRQLCEAEPGCEP